MALGKRQRSKSARRNVVSKKARGPTSFPAFRKLPALDRAIWTKSIVVYSDYSRSVDPGIAGCASYVYSLNGLYDPDISGVGGQPTGFDQYMALYGKYTVLKAKVIASCINYDSTTTQCCGVNIAGLPTTDTDPSVYLRNNNMGFQLLDQQGHNQSIAKFTFEVDISKLSSVNIWTDGEFSGTASTNPENQWYLIVWNAAVDTTVNPAKCYWTTRIEYLVAFRDGINAANS